MKSRRAITLILLLMLNAFAGTAQNITDKKLAGERTAVRTFTFRATYIQPMSGTQTYLSGVDYTVDVTADSVVCYLPYRGVAYTAPMDLREGGIKFTSRDFSYSTSKRRNGREEITIEPKDNQNVRRLSFSIAPGGSAFLSVTLSRAQPVSFSGEIE